MRRDHEDIIQSVEGLDLGDGVVGERWGEGGFVGCAGVEGVAGGAEEGGRGGEGWVEREEGGGGEGVAGGWR